MATTFAKAELYTHPGFAPTKAVLTGVPVEVVGEIPVGMDGLFLRNGANSLHERPQPHMFDGSAMLHAIEIRDGEARYSNCVVRTPFTEHIMQLGENPYMGFGELTSAHPTTAERLASQRERMASGALRNFSRLEQVFSSTAVLHHDDRLYCLQETGLPFAIDVERDGDGWVRIPGSGHLENFGGMLDAPFSAHPKTDVATGEVHSIGQNSLTGETVHTVLAPGGSARTDVIATTRPSPMYSHDAILTERWIVFADSSLLYVPHELGEKGSMARFDPARRMRFGVIARDHATGEKARWFETAAPGHVWHIANGWEEDGRLHLFAPVFRDYPASVPIHSPAEPHAEFVHWALDLASGEVEEDVLIRHSYERPGMDMRRSGTRSPHVWLLDEQRGGGVMAKGVLKYDLIDRADVAYVDYGDLFGGEPVFVPRDPDRSMGDDDGWICDLLANEDRAELIVLDAATMVECCRIRMPHRVPFGVHGLWLGRSEVDRLIAT